MNIIITSIGGVNRLLAKYYSYRVISLGLKCGFTIARNCVGKGLSLAHVGNVIINSSAKVGENCRIHAGVNIGTAAGTSDQTPTIGNNVYIGPGAKIFGKNVIADGIAIGANSVVNKSFEVPNVTIAGVPAKIISQHGSNGMLMQDKL